MRFSRSAFVFIALALGGAPLAACTGDDNTLPLPPEAGADAKAGDGGKDATTEPDAGKDGEADASRDATSDGTVEDAGPDATPDGEASEASADAETDAGADALPDATPDADVIDAPDDGG
ncbi:MAG TPA: hypothetical protein VHV30_17255 [Polyangiaceae bacterium]|jgi:hypothetical protein|nr:hypothetical protein [Polyangiaceae bacterium]